MRIPFSKPSINLNVLKDIEKVIKSGWLIEGKYTAEFEAKFSEYIGVKYAVADLYCRMILYNIFYLLRFIFT